MRDWIYGIVVGVILLVSCCGGPRGCESENISQCGYACQRQGSRMLKYNHVDGCVCDTGNAHAP